MVGGRVMEERIDDLCGYCGCTDNCIYTSNPPQVKCNISGEYHFLGHSCNIVDSIKQSYLDSRKQSNEHSKEESILVDGTDLDKISLSGNYVLENREINIPTSKNNVLTIISNTIVCMECKNTIYFVPKYDNGTIKYKYCPYCGKEICIWGN